MNGIPFDLPFVPFIRSQLKPIVGTCEDNEKILSVNQNHALRTQTT